MSNPICWFEIYVQDMNRAKKFYESVFETRLSRLESPDGKMDGWTFPMEEKDYGSTGALVRMEGVPSGGNSTLVYFACDDCSVQANRTADHGGKVFKEKFSIGQYGFIALVFDTEGNMIGLHSMK